MKNNKKRSRIRTILSATIFCSVLTAGALLSPHTADAGFMEWVKDLFSGEKTKNTILFDVRTAVHKIKLGSDEKGNYIELTDLQTVNTENDRPSKEDATVKFTTAFNKIKSSGSMVYALCLEGTDRSAIFPGVMTQEGISSTYRVYLTENANKTAQLQNLKKIETYLLANPNQGTAFFNALALKAAQTDYAFFASGGCFVEKLDATHWRIVFKGVDEVLVIGTSGMQDTLLTAEFKDTVWDKTFEKSPPNVAFTAKNSDGSRVFFPMKLSKPSFDPATQQLSFEGTFLADGPISELPNVLKTSDTFETFAPVWVMLDNDSGDGSWG